MQKYSVLLHSPAQDLQALETEAQFAAVRFERLGFQAFATNLEYKLILLRGVYICIHTGVYIYIYTCLSMGTGSAFRIRELCKDCNHIPRIPYIV